jgi:hypothetical protein
MSRPDWRDPADYETLRSADVATLAGEFLRRNPDYQADRRRLVRLAAEHRLTQAERDAFALAWGVRFRCLRRAAILDLASLAHHHQRGRDAADSGGDVAPR